MTEEKTNKLASAVDSQSVPATEQHSTTPLTVRSRINWVDTDAAGRWHYTTAFRLFESAEAELLAGLGLDVAVLAHLPRVHVEADMKHVLNFFDIVETTIRVHAVGNSSVTFAFEVIHDERIAVTGRIVAVYIDADGRSAQLPQELSGALRTYQGAEVNLR